MQTQVLGPIQALSVWVHEQLAEGYLPYDDLQSLLRNLFLRSNLLGTALRVLLLVTTAL